MTAALPSAAPRATRRAGARQLPPAPLPPSLLPRSCCTAALEAVQGRRGLLSVSASLCYLLLSHQSLLTLHEFTVAALPSRGHGPRHCPLRSALRTVTRHLLLSVRRATAASPTQGQRWEFTTANASLCILSYKNTIELVESPLKSMSP